VLDAQTNPDPNPPRRRPTIVAAGLLLAALALVVIYTNRGAFLSPLALVVVAAIGVAALLLQLRMRSDPASSLRGQLWLTGLGVLFALVAVLADFLHFNPTLMLVAALVAVVSFAAGGMVVLSALRKRRA
jgi:peptidoglycan/LPS O-acetylase OafA/YrhL